MVARFGATAPWIGALVSGAERLAGRSPRRGRSAFRGDPKGDASGACTSHLAIRAATARDRQTRGSTDGPAGSGELSNRGENEPGNQLRNWSRPLRVWTIFGSKRAFRAISSGSAGIHSTGIT